jgi:ATP-dependent exoDNAse (exonuclease V) alpha subunit
VVDEASMLDLFLAHSLLKAVAKETQLLLVGDTDSTTLQLTEFGSYTNSL